MKNLMLRSALMYIAALGLSSCEVPRRVAFHEMDFAGTRGSGTGSVVGQAFTIFKDNSIHYAANDSVDLAPVNAYTREIVERRVTNGENMAPADPRYAQYLRSAPTDEEGRFEFHHLPPGDYYVATKVYWTHVYWMNDNDGILQKNKVPRSQWIYVRISVKNGETVIVNDWNQCHAETE